MVLYIIIPVFPLSPIVRTRPPHHTDPLTDSLEHQPAAQPSSQPHAQP